MTEVNGSESETAEPKLGSGEEQAREEYWIEYAKNHSPVEVGQMLAQKEKEADTDFLTGVYNRRGWEKQLNVFSRLAERKGEPISFFVIDIDQFKKINDEWGHEVGDHCLIFISQVLKDLLRESDILARMGGDEFAVLMPFTNIDEAKNIRSRLVDEFDKSFDEIDNDDELKAIGLSFSIGVSMKLPAEDSAVVIAKADQDMYKVKGNKKDVQ
jgi:diguanylate cyclase (GGDEF)-like protein